MNALNFKELHEFINNLNANQYYSTEFTYNNYPIRIYISTYANNPFFVLLININNTTITKDIIFIVKSKFVNINKFWSPNDYEYVKNLPKEDDLYSFNPFYKNMMEHVVQAELEHLNTYQIKDVFSNSNNESRYFYCIARGGMQDKQYIKSCAIIGKHDTDLLKKRNLGIRFTPHIFKKKEFSIDLHDY